MNPSRRYRVRPVPPLVWRIWGDQSVVFDEASGDTHLLDAVGREAMDCLSVRSHSAGWLSTALAARLDVPDDGVLQAYVDRLLLQLDELGLIEIVDT